MPNVFISYSRRNKRTAEQIVAKLQSEGIADIFLDKDPENGINPGSDWEKTLKTKVAASKIMLLIVSPAWLQSKHCFNEYQWAINAKRNAFGMFRDSATAGPLVIPVLVEGVTFDTLKTAQPRELQKLQALNGYEDLKVSLELAQEDADAASIKALSEEQKAALHGLWEWLSGEFRKRGVTPVRPPFDPSRPPYPGLSSLLREDAAIFFGREALVDETVDQLVSMRDGRGKKMLVLLGASGAGKSSLLRAGLMPRIEYVADKFLCLPALRPGGAALSDPREGFIACLAEAFRRAAKAGKGEAFDKRQIKRAVSGEVSQVEDLLNSLVNLYTFLDRQGRRSPPPTLVLPIDQGEELFPLSINDASERDLTRKREADKFRAMLASLLERRKVSFMTVIAIRSDSFPRLQEDECLGAVGKETRDLPPLPQGSYRAVIEGPARVAKIEVEPELIDALLADVSGLGDALPLVAFVLRQLWDQSQKRRIGERLSFRLSAYNALGRLGGAIDKVVEHAIGRDFDHIALRAAFIPHLAVVSEQNQVLRRIAKPDELPAEAMPMIDALIDKARLLQRDADGEIEVAHEAVLRQWTLLAGWLENASNALGLLNTAETDAAAWRNERAGKGPRETSAVDQARLYPQERLDLLYTALEHLGLPKRRIGDLHDFIAPEHRRLTAEIAATVPREGGGVDVIAGHARRTQIGNRLDDLGDPRPGVGLLSRDALDRRIARLEREASFGFPSEPRREHQLRSARDLVTGDWKLPLPDIAWCAVPSGEVTMRLAAGSGDTATQKTVSRTIGEQFWVSKYPITIVQLYAFGLLRDENGEFSKDKPAEHFLDKRWWTGFPEEFSNPHAMRVAERDAQTNYPAQFVSWYQSVALGRWLTAVYRSLGFIPDWAEIRLPTEWEWQQAATGGDASRIYPWGEDWRPEFCRNSEGQESACAVGLYPHGDASTGASDMSGLTYEWCLNGFDDLENQDVSSTLDRPSRGGGYFTQRRGGETRDAVSVHGRLQDKASGVNDNGQRIRVGVRLICTGFSSSADAVYREDRLGVFSAPNADRTAP
ncbi:MAG: SUMF1/EgtB/PvdO family nonheme iron enzyme [Hyphomicrobiales bacterium]|nr:SUMF1/EgtB/PvdO family nonheme iron enzyme [Hyphomicrobiales bacterium]